MALNIEDLIDENGVLNLPPLELTLAKLCKLSFYDFVIEAWHIVEPGSPLINGWHLQAICDHLQAVAENRIKNLIIAIPPRHSKSTIVSVMFPAWLWIRYPGKRTLFVSYAAVLSDRDSRKCRALIESLWYKTLFGDVFKLAKDSNTIRRFDNDQGGMRFATSIEGTLTGEGANFVCADDLHNIQEIHSDVKREGANNTWDSTLSSRINPPVDEGHFVVIAQRSHCSDLIGHIKEKNKVLNNYTILELPAEFVVAKRCRTYLGKDEHGQDIYWEDPRTRDGELLWPEGCPQSYLEIQKVNLGTFAYSAQYQQDPIPAEGGIFNMGWFQRYWPQDLPYPRAWDDSCISIDMNFGSNKKDVNEVSWVVATAWCRVGARFYLLDMIRGQWKYVESKRQILAFIKLWRMIWSIYVENKANGPAIMDDLMETEGMAGIIPIDPKDWGGDKKSRAYSVTPICEALNVFLPDELSPVGVRIMNAVLKELGEFPMGSTNDIVDSITQALNKMRSRYVPMGMGACGGEQSPEEQLRFARQVVPDNVVTNQIVYEHEVPFTIIEEQPENLPLDTPGIRTLKEVVEVVNEAVRTVLPPAVKGPMKAPADPAFPDDIFSGEIRVQEMRPQQPAPKAQHRMIIMKKTPGGNPGEMDVFHPGADMIGSEEVDPISSGVGERRLFQNGSFSNVGGYGDLFSAQQVAQSQMNNSPVRSFWRDQLGL